MIIIPVGDVSSPKCLLDSEATPQFEISDHILIMSSSNVIEHERSLRFLWFWKIEL